MCFSIHQNHPKSKIATKDIKTFKVLSITDGRISSPFKDFTYVLGKTYKLRLWFGGIFDKKNISRGYHAYSTPYRAHILARDLTDDNKTCEVFETMIPKGARYFYNPADMEYVSNRIVCVAPLSKPEKSDVSDGVLKIIRNNMDSDIQIYNDTDIVADLGADNLDMVEIFMAVERDFGIAIDDNDTESLRIVSEMIKYVNDRKAIQS